MTDGMVVNFMMAMLGVGVIGGVIGYMLGVQRRWSL